MSDHEQPQDKKPEGWQEPPVSDESSRPVDAERWFAPKDAAEIPSDDAESSPSDEMPAAAPEQAGAWYTPADAQLDAFLAGADETIIEHHAPEPLPPTPAREEPALAWEAPQLTSAPAPTEVAAEPAGAPAEAADVAADSAIVAETPIEDEVQPTQVLSDTGPVLSAVIDSAASTDAAASAAETPVEAPTPVEAAAPAADVVPLSDIIADSAPVASASPIVAARETVEPPQRPTPVPQPDRFEEVERKVSVLRARFRAGHVTRDELQQELRNLMILDDNGHWWMLGMESDRWYRFDGANWLPENPPGFEARVRGSAVRTETGMQEVVPDSAAAFGDTMGEISLTEAEDAEPLPARVPVDDPGATLVSPGSALLEPMRRSDAPTASKAREVDAGAGVTVPHPASAGVYTQDVTVQSDAMQATGISDMGQVVPEPKPALGKWPQPDYSIALGSSYNRSSLVKWSIRLAIFGTIAGMVVTLIALLAMIGYYFYIIQEYQDDVASLTERAASFQTTRIYDANGAELASFDDPTTGVRETVALNKISPWLLHATISTENETFYTDPGFSVTAIVRAAWQNVQAGGTVSGASTITQQIARALVLDTSFAYDRTTERKVSEIIVASEIKRQYSKNEILQIYLNEIFYGNRAYGIEAAAQAYFQKSAAALNPAEAAFLAGLPQAPAAYDPVVNREAAIGRMHTVLRLMAESNGTGCVAIQHEDTSPWAIPNGGQLCILVETGPDGEAIYYYTTPNEPEPVELVLDIAMVETRDFSLPEVQTTHPHFVNYVWQQLEETYGPQAIYSAGYQVYTTLDENIQSATEQSVTQRLADLQARGVDATNASVVVMRPTDGAVVGMVGSADYYNEDIDGQVNVAFTAQQPGSSIKPFVYLTAFEPDAEGNYMTPASVLWDVYSDFSGYVPANYDRQYHGPKTVRESLSNSLNIPAVKALQYVGLSNFEQMAERAGLTFPVGTPTERQAGLTTALGAVEVRLFDMVQGYAMLARNGRRVEPYSIQYIEDAEGNQIFQPSTEPNEVTVVQAEYAYLVTSILADNQARIEEFSAGWPMELQNGRVAAVKTGTSNDNRDVWAIGYTPQYVVGVWVGNTDNRPMYGLTGYSGSAPIWNDVMEAAHLNLDVYQFERPPGIVDLEVCNDTGALADASCIAGTHWEVFASSAPPPSAAEGIFRTLQVDGYTGKLANEYCNDELETRTFLAINDSWAFQWLNESTAGREWLAARDIEAPVMPPPTEGCLPGEQRPNVVINMPYQDMTVEGNLPIRGSISMPDFNRYEIRLAPGHDPQEEDFSQLIETQQVQHPNPDESLGTLDTRTLANGAYTLRVMVIDNQSRNVKREIRIVVNNPQVASPTPAPTITPAGVTPIDSTPVGTPVPPGGDLIPTATLAPTLTPSWTPTPTP